MVLAPDVVLVDTRVALDDTAKSGTAQRVRDFNAITVLRKNSEAWQLQSVRAYPVAAAAR